MGGFANTQQENQPTQVYYDPAKQQYFSYKQDTQPKERGYQTAQNFGTAPLFAALFPQFANPNRERMYLNNPYTLPDRFKTNAQVTPYAELTNLFPSLNNNAQSLLAPADTESSGAGRFLSSSNTQGK